MVLVNESDAVLVGKIGSPPSIAITDGDDLDARHPLKACDVQTPLEAAPDDTDLKGRISLYPGHLIITLP